MYIIIMKYHYFVLSHGQILSDDLGVIWLGQSEAILLQGLCNIFSLSTVSLLYCKQKNKLLPGQLMTDKPQIKYFGIIT